MTHLKRLTIPVFATYHKIALLRLLITMMKISLTTNVEFATPLYLCSVKYKRNQNEERKRNESRDVQSGW